MSNIGVLFFCLGLLMFVVSIILFVFSAKNKAVKREKNNIENDRLEVDAILSDAKELLKQMDSYSSTTLATMDEKINEMKNMLDEFNNIKKEINDYRNTPNISISDNNQYNVNSIDKNDNNINNSFVKMEENIENPLHKKIIEMYSNKEKIEDISRQLNMGKNEVKLIINRYVKK